MSALKHGLFYASFMLCDRCLVNASCKRFQTGSQCLVEKEAFEGLINELTKQYELDMVADRILAERAAMYLIRISRAESYETTVGITDKSVFWAIHISRLDNTLRGLLNDLAVTRAKRKGLEKTEQLMINIEDLLEHLTNRKLHREATTRLGMRTNDNSRRRTADKTRVTLPIPKPTTNIYQTLLLRWRNDKNKLLKKPAHTSN